MAKPIETMEDLAKIAGAELGIKKAKTEKAVVEEIIIKPHPNYEHYPTNAYLWWWYHNSYPSKKGIHFSFTTNNLALQFMREFKTWAAEKIVDSMGKDWFVISNIDQSEPTEKQYAWIRKCDPNKEEEPVVFEEFQRGYKFWEGKKDKNGKTVWYVSSKDFEKGRGYYTCAVDKDNALWELKRCFESTQVKGVL